MRKVTSTPVEPHCIRKGEECLYLIQKSWETQALEQVMKYLLATSGWLLAGGVLFFLTLTFTAFLALGVFSALTQEIIFWLLQRPVTPVDCVLRQWNLLGSPPTSLLFTLLLGWICLRLGYRRRLVAILLASLMIGMGVEYLGKRWIT